MEARGDRPLRRRGWHPGATNPYSRFQQAGAMAPAFSADGSTELLTVAVRCRQNYRDLLGRYPTARSPQLVIDRRNPPH